MELPPTSTALTLAERRPLREDVRHAIVNAILTGEFQPGERIVESRVARQLGVSQSTVREALRHIEQLGIIVSIPHRGVVVRPLTRRDVVEMYEMRSLLEGYAARRAVAHLTDEALAELDRLVTAMQEAALGGNTPELIARDVDFHARICALADHHLLSRLWAGVNPHLWTYVAARGILNLTSSEIAARHLPILEAFRSRDADQAEAAIRAHLLELRDLAAHMLAKE